MKEVECLDLSKAFKQNSDRNALKTVSKAMPFRLCADLQYALTCLMVNFSVVCISFLRDLREWRCFLRPWCCSYGHGVGNGSPAVPQDKYRIQEYPWPSAVVPTQ